MDDENTRRYQLYQTSQNTRQVLGSPSPDSESLDLCSLSAPLPMSDKLVSANEECSSARDNSELQRGRLELDALLERVGEGHSGSTEYPNASCGFSSQTESLSGKTVDTMAIKVPACQPSGQPRSTSPSITPNQSDVSTGNDHPSRAKARRNENNRIAAARLRKKKRAHVERLQEQLGTLSALNAQLQVSQLQATARAIENKNRMRDANKLLKDKVTERKFHLAWVLMKGQQFVVEERRKRRLRQSEGRLST
ncbi:hypothetical protein NDN08_003589 [Rhodosorus marinus]|uniref:BZIP domain-containing protein n=1 Tax=Rhodosorus marinus TaxID=101924 RepID=A0AAV8V1P9_9RHOD|nr:hypothetical protein NDN08_003589 [Rhodosorus marinus]